jgi:hypothetical protein
MGNNNKRKNTKCLWCDKKLVNKQIKFCSKACKNKHGVNKKRYTTKLKAIKYKGGKCLHCGFNKHLSALTFHHADPDDKSFSISSVGLTKKWSDLTIELDKCILLCANCHHILHYEENSRNEKRKTK